MKTNSSDPIQHSTSTNSNDDADRLLGDVAEDFFQRVSQGDQPSIEEYAGRYPEIADLIRDTFAAVAFINRSSAGESHSGANGVLSTDPHGPSAVGDFRIVREIGRGGMGVVYEAEQLSLGRLVALKVLPYAAMLDQKAITRFKNEARAAATLDHPNIVPIHSVGNERGIHYYAMSLINGVTVAVLIERLQQEVLGGAGLTSSLSLDELLNSPMVVSGTDRVSQHDPTVESADPADRTDRSTSAGEEETDRARVADVSTQASRFDRGFYCSVAMLAAQAADALDHAHQHGIVHRDIKPGNLMIDGQAKLWVTDFGLARIERDAGMTMTGDLVGTLRYMSPEQALAQRVVVDHRADVYSLGATIYELLALRPAFDGVDRQALLKQIALDDPKPLRQCNRSVPVDLQTIIHKALSKSPDDRFDSAQELAADLRAFASDEPIQARPLTIHQLASRWAVKRIGLVASILGVTLMLLVILIISNAMVVKQSNIAIAAGRKERAARELAEENAQIARESVDKFLTKVSEEQLLNTDSLQPLRRELLQLALEYYQTFTRQQPDDAERLDELADAFRRVGQISNELGDPDSSLAAHCRELELREDLLSHEYEAVDALYNYACAKEEIGWAHYQLGNSQKAKDNLQEAISLVEKLVDSHRDRGDFLDLLGSNYIELSLVYQSRDKSLEMRQRGIAILESLNKMYPGNTQYQTSLAMALANGTNVREPGMDVDLGPIADRRRAIELMQEIEERGALDLYQQSLLGIAYGNLGNGLKQLGQVDDARLAYGISMRLQEDLVRRNPDISKNRLNLSRLYFAYCGTLSSDQRDECLKWIRKAIEEIEPYAERYPDEALYRGQL